ncbi:hypothetical protein GCM10007276_27470 [Agaricicola taiwanensis]|uniref:Uncharacterized protein n=1 Tax=Agaricicola taiwanensis TaxID=591372 RepID=A0A8J2YKN0_9RHOB|nr:hypothetical protein [Agaricicola taiwanensis]GGE48815.1 hypothetical protein GCM10007276_27470 [Agaricicola taiwanensis]
MQSTSLLPIGTRLAIVAVAMVTGLWGLSAVMGRAKAGADVEVVARRILQERPYPVDRLSRLRAATDGTHCEYRFARTVIQLRLFEEALTHPTADDERRQLEADMSALAQCNPNEGFFPLVGAALALGNGDTAGFGSGLMTSYRNAPRENWIALRRSPLALERFDDLSPDLQRHAVEEFSNFVNSGMNDEAADIFTGLDAETRGHLIASLGTHTGAERRVSFFNTLLADRDKPRKSSVSRKLIENFSLPSGTSLPSGPAE